MIILCNKRKPTSFPIKDKVSRELGTATLPLLIPSGKTGDEMVRKGFLLQLVIAVLRSLLKLTLLVIQGGGPVQRVASLQGLLDALMPFSEEEAADQKPE